MMWSRGTRGWGSRAALSLLSMLMCAGGWLSAQGDQRRLTVSAISSAVLGRRVALVLGNSAYARAPLTNAAKDARDVAALLRGQVGFDLVLSDTDVGLAPMERRIEEFLSSLRAGDLAFLYYAGHGVEQEGINYLIPTDFAAETERQVPRQAVSAQDLLKEMSTRGASARVMVLDMCRDNPFRGTRSKGGGLAPMQARGALVMFAAEEGRTASDRGGANGVFTAAFLAAARVPGRTLREIFYDTRAGVLAATQREQFPALYDMLEGDVLLVPGPPGATAAPTPSPSPPPSPASAPTTRDDSALPPVRLGGGVKPPRKVRDVKPEYPEVALSARIAGVVILEARLDPSGRVQRVRVLKSIPLLDEAAVAAVMQWEYAPTLLEGVPRAVIMTVTVNFTIG